MLGGKEKGRSGRGQGQRQEGQKGQGQGQRQEGQEGQEGLTKAPAAQAAKKLVRLKVHPGTDVLNCKFSVIGCTDELVFKDLEEHYENCKTKHLDLALNRILEQQQVIVKLHKSVANLEAKTKRHQQMLMKLDGTMTATDINRKTTNRKSEIYLSDQMSRLDQKLSKKLAEHSNEMNGQLEQMRKLFHDTYDS